MTPDNSVPLDSDLAKNKFALLHAVMSIEANSFPHPGKFASFIDGMI